MAHGSSGELGFSAGALSLAHLDEVEDDLAAIGDALGPDGELLLWSCQTGEGARGRVFVEALSRAAGAPVAASKGLVGAAEKGGSWELEIGSGALVTHAPLTAVGRGELHGCNGSEFYQC